MSTWSFKGREPTLGLISVLGISNFSFPGFVGGPLDRGLRSSVQKRRTRPLTLSMPWGELKGMLSLGHEDSAQAGCFPFHVPVASEVSWC